MSFNIFWLFVVSFLCASCCITMCESDQDDYLMAFNPVNQDDDCILSPSPSINSIPIS